MARISFDFKNIVGSRKCAVSSPRIVSLEIGDESPGRPSESFFQEIFLNDKICRNDVQNNTGLICGYDKPNDKNFLIHSQSSLSTFDDRPSDKTKSTNDSDIDLDLQDLLYFADLKQAVETGAGNINSQVTASDDKMKIILNVEVNDGASDLLSLIAHDFSDKDESESNFEYCQRNNTQDCGIDLPDFEIVKNECEDSLSSKNPSLKIEGNLSDLLSSINIKDSGVTNNTSNMCYSNIANQFGMENEPPVANLSDLLSSIDLGDSNDNKVGSCNKNDSEAKNESCLSDLLSSINIEDSDVTKVRGLSSNMCNLKVANKSELENVTPVADLSDLLSSIDLGGSNDNKVGSYNKNDSEAKNEPCLADLLSSIVMDKSNKPASALLNNKTLTFDSSDLYFNGAGNSDSLSDCTFDITSSSSNSCASSYSGKEDNSSKDSTKNNLTDKIFESDSGYSSVDSAHKGFSFFDYSSDNQLSFNTLLSKKPDVSMVAKQPDNENASEEMSMSDLMTIVSPEFKSPVLTTIKTEKLEGSITKDGSSMLDLIACQNTKDSHAVYKNSVQCDEKLMNYDCVDGRISKNIQSGTETTDIQEHTLLEKDDASIWRSDFTNDEEQFTFIDLRECIKSTENQFNPTSPVKQHKSVENKSSEGFSPSKIPFYSEDRSLSSPSQNKSTPFEFNNMVPRKKSRVNTKQTLFSKALACKPKKDHNLLQKVASIKNGLLKNIINRPVFIDCDVPQPIVESVLQSDRCILSYIGRRSFGLDASCELQ